MRTEGNVTAGVIRTATVMGIRRVTKPLSSPGLRTSRSREKGGHQAFGTSPPTAREQRT